MDRMLAFLPVCAELGGAKLIIGAIRGWTRDAGGRDVYGSLFHASLEEILNQAEPLGVPVALEAISRMDSDAYCSVAETADFIRSFHSSALRLQLDSIHLHTNGETQFCEEILRAGELIGQVDISDVGRMAPDGDHFDFPKLIRRSRRSTTRTIWSLSTGPHHLSMPPRQAWTTSAACSKKAYFHTKAGENRCITGFSGFYPSVW